MFGKIGTIQIDNMYMAVIRHKGRSRMLSRTFYASEKQALRMAKVNRNTDIALTALFIIVMIGMGAGLFRSGAAGVEIMREQIEAAPIAAQQ